MILHKPSKDILDSIKQDSSLPKGYYYLYAKDIEQSLKIQTDFHTNAMGYKAFDIYTLDTHTQYKLSYCNHPLVISPIPKALHFSQLLIPQPPHTTQMKR